MEKEKNEKVVEKPFDLDDFYRKVGIGLLLLLVFLITVFGSILFVIQNKILKQTSTNFIEKSSLKLVNPNSTEITDQKDKSGETVPPSGEETPGLDKQDVTE